MDYASALGRNADNDAGLMHRPTLPPGEFLGSRRLLRSQGCWHAYRASYPPSVSYGMHDHERAALCMVLSGSYREHARGRSIEASAGAIVQQPAGNHHADDHGEKAVELLIIEFAAEPFGRLECPTPMLAQRAFRSDASTTKIVAKLRREVEASDLAAPLMCDALVLECVAMLCRAEAPQKDRAPAWLGRVDDRIRALAMPPASLAELAAEAGLHPAHLTRAFRQHRGLSIGAYRRQIMVEEARRLLEQTDRSLAVIAADVGFADQSHMTRLFSTKLGRTPAALRREQLTKS